MALSSLLQQAKLAAKLRYDPQAQALQELLRQSQEGYRTGVAGERGAARGIAAAIRDAAPTVQKIYATQGETLKQDRKLAQRYLTNLTAAAQPFQAAAASEHTGALDRLAADRSTATHEISQRRLEAASGEQLNINNLRGSYLSDVGKIGTRLADLGATEGAYAADAYGKLLDAEAKNALSRARLKQTAYDNRQSRKIAQQNADANTTRATNSGRSKGGRSRALGAGPNAKALDQISQAQGWIDTLSANGRLNGHQIRALLRNGHKTAGGTTIPAFGRDITNTAFDVHDLGGISPTNLARLHHRGVRIGSEYKPLTWAQVHHRQRTYLKNQRDTIGKTVKKNPFGKPLTKA